MLLAALALVLAVCVQSESIVKAVVDAKVDAVQTVQNATKAAIDTKAQAHKALAQSVRAAFTPSPSSPSPAPSSPPSGLLDKKVTALADFAQTPTGQAAAKRFVNNHPVLVGVAGKVVANNPGLAAAVAGAVASSPGLAAAAAPLVSSFGSGRK